MSGGTTRHADRGAASIYAAVVGLVLVLAGLSIAVAAARLVTAAQAQAAADLAALAGARHVASGETAACAHAATLATRNSAELLACRLDGPDLTLTVRVRDTEATARAGPIRTTHPTSDPQRTDSDSDAGGVSAYRRNRMLWKASSQLTALPVGRSRPLPDRLRCRHGTVRQAVGRDGPQQRERPLQLGPASRSTVAQKHPPPRPDGHDGCPRLLAGSVAAAV